MAAAEVVVRVRGFKLRIISKKTVKILLFAIVIILCLANVFRWSVLDSESTIYYEFNGEQEGEIVWQKDNWTGEVWERHYVLFSYEEDRTVPHLYFEIVPGTSYGHGEPTSTDEDMSYADEWERHVFPSRTMLANYQRKILSIVWYIIIGGILAVYFLVERLKWWE